MAFNFSYISFVNCICNSWACVVKSEVYCTCTVVGIAAATGLDKVEDECEVPTSLLQTYQLGKVLYKMDAVTVRACEDRYTCLEICHISITNWLRLIMHWTLSLIHI